MTKILNPQKIVVIVLIILITVILWNLFSTDPDKNSSGNASLQKHGSNGLLTSNKPPPKQRRSAAKKSESQDSRISKIWKKGTLESNLVGYLLEPFDQEELVELVNSTNKDESRLIHLILRAGAERDSRFLYLLNRKDLRENTSINLAISIYDYSLNRNVSSLDDVIYHHIQNKVGWDSDTVMALAYVDEWERTKKIFESHYMSQDGAGALSKDSFWLTRRYLFPHSKVFNMNFEQFSKDIDEKQQAAKQKTTLRKNLKR